LRLGGFYHAWRRWWSELCFVLLDLCYLGSESFLSNNIDFFILVVFAYVLELGIELFEIIDYERIYLGRSLSFVSFDSYNIKYIEV
jgi:hypothetical protein